MLIGAEQSLSQQQAISALDLSELPAVAAIEESGEHLLLSDGLRSLQLEVVQGTLLRGPVDLTFCIEEAHTRAQIEALQSLLALRRRGQLSGCRAASVASQSRWIRQLRVHDALAAGASQRQIGIELFGSEETRRHWKEGSGAVRSSVQRLVRAALRNVAGSYLKFLP